MRKYFGFLTKKVLFLLAPILLAPVANAKVLTKINVLPPANGYVLNSVSETAQLSTLCTYDDSTTDNCSSQTLTWGSSNDSNMTVSSSGLASWGPGYGGGIASIVRSGNVVTVTTNSNFVAPLYSYVIIEGMADTSFNGSFYVTGKSSGPSNVLTYSNTGPDVSTSGGKMYFQSGTDAYVYSGTVLGHHPLIISPNLVASMLVRPETSTTNTLTVGSTVLVSAEDSTTTPVDGTPVGDYCAWTSSTPSVATVDSIGNVLGVSAGSTTVTCTLHGVTASEVLYVTSPTIASNTWYVRDDGGTIKDANVPGGQCDGTLNVPYAGSTGGHCAVNSPMYLITDETSTTAHTGLVGPGDTAIITPKADGTPYLMGSKSQDVAWVVGGAGSFPSGTPSNPTRILGSNYASCSANSAKTKIENYWAGIVFDVRGTQNLDIECLEMSNWTDCNQGLENNISFSCPVNTANPNGIKSQFPFIADTFSSNILVKNVKEHGFTNAWTGTPGPGLVIQDTSGSMNWQAGWDFDDPYGYKGNRTEGFTGNGLEAAYNGCTEELPKSLSSVSRDGSGNLNVSFAAGQTVNYVSGTNLVLTGMTPSDLNGTFPVSAITFNQEAVTITGGTCDNNISQTSSLTKCTLTTSTAPAFIPGSFVNIAGATPSWLNGNYEVFSSSSTGFVVAASGLSHPGWTAATVSSGGTASTAISLTATAAGSAESATTVGTASHVIPIHRCEDQYDSGYADGDGVGTGDNTIGVWQCDKCKFTDNLQDGWDMLHSAMDKSSYTNSTSKGNEGAPAKFGNMDVGTFYNNVDIANGGSLLAFNADKAPDFNQYIATPYRAGDTFPINERMWTRVTITNNTFMGGFNTMVDDGCTDANNCHSLPAFEKFEIQNNIWIGFQDVNNPTYNSSVPGMYCGNSCNNSPNENGNWVWTNNIGFNVRNYPTGTGNNWSIDPGVIKVIPDILTFADEYKSLDFNVLLTSTANARGFSVVNADVPTYDNVHYLRPSPAAAGALEYQVGTLMTVTVSPSSASVAVGGNTTFTAACSYSDGSSTPCTVSWTDTSNHSSVNTATGIVTGTSVGTDTITATLNSIYGTATVTITPAPVSHFAQAILFRGPIK